MNNIKKAVFKLKTVGLKKTIKQIVAYCIRPLVPALHDYRWNHFNSSRAGKHNNEKCSLIVSLTTYPARIESVHYTIESLLMQTMMPEHLILWLAKDQFPNQERDLPKNLLTLEKFGLQIMWCADFKSYKKLIPTLNLYPDALIITADDDIYYHPRMVESLYKAYLQEPNYIHCHRGTKFYMNEDEFKTVAGGYDIYRHPSYLHKLTGCGGVCYPPHSLYDDVTNENLFMDLAPTNDDIWFWLMGVLNGYKCNILDSGYTALFFVADSQDESLCSVNDRGENLFWIQFYNILRVYPKIRTLLEDEWKNISS